MFKIKKQLNDNMERLITKLENRNLEEIFYILGNKKEIAKRNFIAGVFRGIGIGIGVTIVTAIIIYFLQKLVKLNLPIIGEYINDIVDIIQATKKY